MNRPKAKLPEQFALLSFCITALSILSVYGFISKMEGNIEDTCNSNATCSTANSFCDSEKRSECNVSVCSCLPTHAPFTKPNDTVSCLEKAVSILDPCEQNEQCLTAFGELSACVDKTCQCINDTVFCPTKDPNQNGGKCRSRRNLGDSCTCHQQCNQTTDAYCDLYNFGDTVPRCICGTENMEAPDGLTCIPFAQMLGESCELHPDQCKYLRDAKCDDISKKCECNSTTHVPYEDSRYSQCLPKRTSLNMPCFYLSDEQCQPEFSQCEYNSEGAVSSWFCRCPYQTHSPSELIPDTCLEQQHKYGGNCTEDIQCRDGYLGQNSECSRVEGNTCRCKLGSLYDSGYNRCMPRVPLGGKCVYSFQCHDQLGSINMTECYYEICRCIPDFVEIEGSCHKNRTVGQSCDNTNDCRAGISGPIYCIAVQGEKTCQYDDGYQADGGGGEEWVLHKGLLFLTILLHAVIYCNFVTT